LLVLIIIVNIFVKNAGIMTEKEKYEKWRQVAEKMLEEKNIIQEIGVERAKNEYGIKFEKLRLPRVREKK
jgi:hypothetical protein